MSKKRSWKRPLLIFLSLFALLLVGLGIAISRVNRKALDLALGGRDAVSFLKEFSAELMERDQNGIDLLFHPETTADRSSLWREEDPIAAGGVSAARWRRVDLPENLGFGELWIGALPQGKLESLKFKLDAFEAPPGKSSLELVALFWLRGSLLEETWFESKARFRVVLKKHQGSWRFWSHQLLEGNTVFGNRTAFHEVAAEAGLNYRARNNPMFATEAWDPRLFEIFKYSSGGVATADVDRDGHMDVLFTGSGDMALYRNLGQGKFEEITAKAGLPVDQPGFSVALFADWNNDGLKDLFLGGQTVASRFYANRGQGLFEEVDLGVSLPEGLVTTAAASDYDRDGDLDLYLARYLDPRISLPTTLFYTRNGAGNMLLRNDGGFRFRDVTEAAGVRDGGLTLGVAWGDIDGDMDEDLYLANDFGRNTLFVNNGDGSFTDISSQSGTLDFGFGMSAAFGDVDNDGDLDLYVSNVRSSQRWYSQATTLYSYLFNSVRQGTIGEDFSIYREILSLAGSSWQDYGDAMVKGNSLFINDGSGHFRDVSERGGANPHGWYWGGVIFDYDNDGFQDLYAANGWISGEVTDDL